MGKRQEQLAQLLGNESVTLPPPKRINLQGLGYEEAIQEVYVGLGGTQKAYPLNLRAWDMQFNGSAIELDEEQHFHRYRTRTLASHIYEKLPNFPLSLYQTYCLRHESKVRTDGGFWTNLSCDKQFGKANVKGGLDRQRCLPLEATSFLRFRQRLVTTCNRLQRRARRHLGYRFACRSANDGRERSRIQRWRSSQRHYRVD